MIRLLKEIDGKANMKTESNIKDQNKNFETQRVKMKTTPNFKDQKLSVSNTCTLPNGSCTHNLTFHTLQLPGKRCHLS